ncbi:sugar phosphate isomerase/epimerase family protein [Celeribacter neptunius]|uniref:Sugar phosphate isomerase/epimerase n=1 Tax=Celeribacter neptunius TaxID=588602 RepID=A0A1I3YDY3_9RHOB|nr:sugar phosphate isomerase/epimerase family protein [Celeribacter neptunius]SFK29579.1 Sugar phosphate isomerase/epimerase [Celeribacter neptunius]
MKYAISNIAWSPCERLEVYGLLARLGICGLEIAPSLFFQGADDPLMPDKEHMANALHDIDDYGLTPVSMQSTLFGMGKAELFGTGMSAETFGMAMRKSILLAGELELGNIVFGAPKNRIRPVEMSLEAATGVAIAKFKEFGELAREQGVILGVECNPAAYGGNFLTLYDETVAFVRQVNHSNIGLTFDLGSMHMLGDEERIPDVIARDVDLISHVHVSSPFLAPVPSDMVALNTLITSLKQCGYEGWVSVEMKRPNQNGLEEIENSLRHLLDVART